MSKHTKGPWMGGFECINDLRGRLIAEVMLKGVNTTSVPFEEGKANSRLIAAAPKLFEQLNSIHDSEHGSDGACECSTWRLLCEVEGIEP